MSQRESGSRRGRGDDHAHQQQQQPAPPAGGGGSALANNITARWAASTAAVASSAAAAAAAGAAAVNDFLQSANVPSSGTFDDAFNDAAPAVEATLIGALIPANPDGQLQKLFDEHKILLPRVEFRANEADGDKEFIVGRSVDLRVPYRIDFGRLSGNHCKFTAKHKPSPHVTVTDTSTNGVWVNGERIKKGEARVLKSRDVVTLLKPTDDAVHFPFVFECQTEKDKFRDEITCSICLGTYVTPTCVLPCLHTFCGPCVRKYVSEARRSGATSSTVACPECRTMMTATSVNHKVQALISEVTRTNPACERPAHEQKQLEEEAAAAEQRAKKSGIPNPTHLSGDDAKKKKQGDWGQAQYRGDDSEDSDDYYSDDDDSDDDGNNNNNNAWGGGGFGGGAGGFGGGGWGVHRQAHAQLLPMGFAMQQQPQACNNCINPDPRDNFKCPPGGPHILCKYCRKVFPDRPACGIPQRCKFCATPFCDIYCGPCKNPAGVGVLRNVEDTVFDQLPMGTLFKGNNVEQQFFVQYMRDSRLCVKDVWDECLKKWKSKEWTLDITAGLGQINPDTPVCKPCAQRIFADLLVKYRIAIPRDKWPPAVGARPDCWYGLECRTQHGNPMHAQKYNHVCLPRKGKE